MGKAPEGPVSVLHLQIQTWLPSPPSVVATQAPRGQRWGCVGVFTQPEETIHAPCFYRRFLGASPQPRGPLRLGRGHQKSGMSVQDRAHLSVRQSPAGRTQRFTQAASDICRPAACGPPSFLPTSSFPHPRGTPTCLRWVQAPLPANSTRPHLDPGETHTEGWAHPSENRHRRRPGPQRPGCPGGT